ncbi:MAG: RluA family pseudouridine synthase [Nitrospirota bacterium]
MRDYTFIVGPSENRERIDTLLAGKTDITRSQVQKHIASGNVFVNDEVIRQNYKAKTGDRILLRVAERDRERLVPEPIPVQVLYEDPHLIVVDKPPGMVVYPAAGHSHGTLMNALAFHCGGLDAPGGPLRPGVVHRLDKDTSGVMVIARDEKSYYGLSGQFRQRAITRRYRALVYGSISQDTGSIEASIGRSLSDRKKMSTRMKRGKEAVTTWRVLRRFRGATLVEARLGTGRTHQIRVHFASIGHPVLGDRTYGKKVEIEYRGRGPAIKTIAFPRQMLHAEVLGFTHPVTDEYLEFSMPPPEDMARKIEELQGTEPS